MRKYKFKYDLDNPLRSLEHQKIIRDKKSLYHIYKNWYNLFKANLDEQGTYLELGSGGGIIKDIIPQIITSDVNEIPGIDKCFSASEIPFENESIDGIFMLDSLHHFPNVESFFEEVIRVLKPNGIVMMIEPWSTPMSKFIYNKIHHELYDMDRDWFFPLKGPLSGANIALPQIIFERDIDIFNEKYPALHVDNIVLHTPFSYIISGGFTQKSMLPFGLFKLVHKLENKSKWIKSKCSLFATITIKKHAN
ncbi:MAG: class I SAM-dependent methyltransferase [Bacteroidales bacterium]|nr:class I SAM-dependent methyltransferase [Bacteroidales bacterium]